MLYYQSIKLLNYYYIALYILNVLSGLKILESEVSRRYIIIVFLNICICLMLCLLM